MYMLHHCNGLVVIITDLDEIEEELAPLTEALEPPPLETYADQLDKARKETHGLSWVQILGKSKYHWKTA